MRRLTKDDVTYIITAPWTHLVYEYDYDSGPTLIRRGEDETSLYIDFTASGTELTIGEDEEITAFESEADAFAYIQKAWDAVPIRKKISKTRYWQARYPWLVISDDISKEIREIRIADLERERKEARRERRELTTRIKEIEAELEALRA